VAVDLSPWLAAIRLAGPFPVATVRTAVRRAVQTTTNDDNQPSTTTKRKLFRLQELRITLGLAWTSETGGDRIPPSPPVRIHSRNQLISNVLRFYDYAFASALSERPLRQMISGWRVVGGRRRYPEANISVGADSMRDYPKAFTDSSNSWW